MDELDETEAVVVYESPQSLTDLGTEDLISLAETLDKKITAQQKILSLVTKLAGPKGIDHLGNTIYFNSGGCDRIASGVGISYGKPSEERRPLADGYVEYLFTATFTMGNRTISATGGRASNDSFFTSRRDAQGNAVTLSAQEVKARDVRNAAWTNCKNNGIKSLLGLRNLSEEMLQAHGVVTDQGAKVVYGNADPACADRLTEVKAMLKDLADGDPKRGADILEELTGFEKDGKIVGKKRDIAKVSAAVIKNDHENGFYNKLRRRHDAWLKEMENLPTPEEAAERAVKDFGGEPGE
jgi:hypothetical protein